MQSPRRPSAAAAASRRRQRLGADGFGTDSFGVEGFGTDAAGAEGIPGEPDFERIAGSAEFTALRRRARGFGFAMSAVFFLWYLAYVLLSAYSRDFMSRKVFGEVNVGIVFGVLQFVSTIAITLLYLRYARKNLDPSVDLIREQAGVGKA